MRRVWLLTAVSCAILAVAIAVALSPILEVGIEGVVKVSPTLRVVDVELVIDREKGSAFFDLGYVSLPMGRVLARVVVASYEGDFSVAVSGVLSLVSGDREYKIVMPCAITIREPCYRVMVVIPGYDAPMQVEEGTYRATLNLTWVARGTGRFHARLYLEEAHQSSVRVSIVGVRPKATDGWVVAEGSTRSYSMLLDTNTSSKGRVSAWIWVYDPQQQLGELGLLRVFDEELGEVVEEVGLKMLRDGPYWSLLVRIELEPGRSYTVEFTYSGISLKSRINS
ncbi:MAG: hypothetical protein QW290_09990 [Sulfolobales archaeon]